MKTWTEHYVAWLQQIHYTQSAQEATLLDCLNEVQHMGEQIKRLEHAIVEVVKLAPAPVQEVIQGLPRLLLTLSLKNENKTIPPIRRH